ncbi:acyltransferase domain-containing protein [Streptomyces sp. XY006]|uniref:acyltransferase domain-containing protein n=1 Tax=Streptomyces sp. XY006 TaxID=2021410 RepID=UPI000B8BE37F|nr:acyltransferase domain-containing protein [Streptomyces sp. XY006]OXS36120.1 acyltransferase [Streptomyces sp. XY006]
MLPDADALPGILLDLAVPHEDINELVALRRTLTADAGAMRLLEECVEELVRDIGEVGEAGAGVPLGDRLAEAPATLGSYFAAYVFVAALPHTRAFHRERGVPDDIGRHTLADFGRNMAFHRRQHGTGGVLVPQWLTLHFRGELYQLGRLQFERARLGQRTGRAVAASGTDVTPGEPCLNLHIPGFYGPLSPEACDRSLDSARAFFARHFPQERHRVAVCHSWLLDPQLKRYLDPESNIVRFQERFRSAREPGAEPDRADTDPVRFVFGDPNLPVESLPRRTSVERAVGDHLRAGGHWHLGHGWFPL